MLAEDPEHQTERRGCGFTQSTRVFAQAIHRGCRARGGTQQLFAADAPCVSAIRAWAEDMPRVHQLWMHMLGHILQRDAHGERVMLPFEGEHNVGTCSLAEKHFLEIAHDLIPRRGWLRIYCDQDTPVLVEKVNMGEDFSAMSLVPIIVSNVELPPGSLFAVQHNFESEEPGTKQKPLVYPFDRVAVRFLRLTTFVASPVDRSEVFAAQLLRQIRDGFPRPRQTTLEDLTARVGQMAAMR